jgi:hypothetical protein
MIATSSSAGCARRGAGEAMAGATPQARLAAYFVHAMFPPEGRHFSASARNR